LASQPVVPNKVAQTIAKKRRGKSGLQYLEKRGVLRGAEEDGGWLTDLSVYGIFSKSGNNSA
jgi:hypothetical protein